MNNPVIGNILFMAVEYFATFIEYAIVIRCLMSWLPISRDNPFSKILNAITDPIMEPMRKLMQNSPLGRGMMIDFSPILAMLLLMFGKMLLQSVIAGVFL